MDEFELEAIPDDGLYETVLRADRMAAGPEHRPVSSVELQAIAEADSEPGLQVEAIFGLQDGRRITAQLDVRTRWNVPFAELESLVKKSFERFGGTALTSLSLARKDGDRRIELCDMTISFSSRLPFLAHNLALLGELADADATACAETLRLLGVATRRSGKELRLPRWQARKRPGFDVQAAAVTQAFKAAAVDHVGLYAASIPATQSAAIAVTRSSEEQASVDLWISRGLARRQAITSSYCVDLQQYLEQSAGAVFSNRKWRVRAMVGETYSGSQGGGVLPERKPIQWSLNWGARR